MRHYIIDIKEDGCDLIQVDSQDEMIFLNGKKYALDNSFKPMENTIYCSLSALMELSYIFRDFSELEPSARADCIFVGIVKDDEKEVKNDHDIDLVFSFKEI